MAGAYPFLDIAVHDAIRPRFAAGQALVILSRDGDTILWCNGSGARMMGYDTIADALENAPLLPPIARRQIQALGEHAEIGSNRPCALRIPSMKANGPVIVSASDFLLPHHERAILIALNGDPQPSALLSGIADGDQFAALVDSQGAVIAATDDFDTLGYTTALLSELVSELGTKAQRLLKRHVENGKTLLPTGIARIEDHPARYLVIAIHVPASEAEPDPVAEDVNEGSIRFSWNTDANGRIEAMSEPFLVAIGKDGGIVGQSIHSVMERFGLDPDGALTGLMDRHETFSGRQVFWPVSDGGYRISVELAALPTYDRERNFSGYKGFGLARPHVQIEDTHRVKSAAPPEPPVAETVSGLTDTERNAFREIGERLRRASTAATETAPQPPLPETTSHRPEVRPSPVKAEIFDLGSEPAPRSPLPEKPRSKANRSLLEMTPVQENAPAQSAQTRDQTPPDFMDMIAKLPLPILIHSGDVLHFANRELLHLSGYASLDALRAAGGIDAILSAPPLRLSDNDASLSLRTSAGDKIPVQAKLQSVPWQSGKALMLALRPLIRATSTTSPVVDMPIGQETELGLNLAEMQALVDIATDGVVILSPDAQIVSLNRSAEALFGYDMSHVIGKPFSILFAIESRRAIEDYAAVIRREGVEGMLNDGRNVVGREAHGRFIPIFVTLRLLPHERGYCAVLRDMTNWKRVEDKLEHAKAQAERASSQKSNFLARVSHEIRTPLNAIIGFSELMLDEHFGPIGNERYREYLRDINQSGNFVLDLVNDLLDISKIEAGEQELQFEPVSLNDAIEQVVAMMQPQANSERVIIRSSLSSHLPDVVADQRSIRQIALNLLSNAVRYTPAGGQVVVSTVYQPDRSVILRVRDTGIGMTPSELEDAMKPFRQVKSMDRKRGEGTGLGLPLTRAMADANQAHFAISSIRSEGTLVEITFPPTRVLAPQ